MGTTLDSIMKPLGYSQARWADVHVGWTAVNKAGAEGCARSLEETSVVDSKQLEGRVIGKRKNIYCRTQALVIETGPLKRHA
jgi:hypothetical protein